MTATTATKTKTTKVAEMHPPTDIRENTKARRAWLAQTVADVNAQDGMLGKIVGQGSYQCVSVYRVTQVAGRVRHRGTCQVCGNQQVVQAGKLVLHGYLRPGHGWIEGDCTGTGKAPLEVTDELTRALLVSWEAKHAAAAVTTKQAEKLESDARTALYGTGESKERGAYAACPKRPATRFARQALTAEQAATYAAELATWEAAYPLTAALSNATQAAREASTTEFRAMGMVSHYTELLSWNRVGQPLTEEVVA